MCNFASMRLKIFLSVMNVFIYAFFFMDSYWFFLSDRLTMNAFSTKIKVRIVFFRKDFLFCMHVHAEWKAFSAVFFERLFLNEFAVFICFLFRVLFFEIWDGAKNSAGYFSCCGGACFYTSIFLFSTFFIFSKGLYHVINYEFLPVLHSKGVQSTCERCAY